MTSPDPAAGSTARLVVLSGPSGVGKSSVVAHIRRHHPDVWLSISATTRLPRPGEHDGVEYYFVTRPEFEQLAETDQFLEWAEYAGNLYGTLTAPVLEQLAAGVPVLLEVDLQGARQVRDVMPHAQLVFLAPPSWEALVARLTGRGTEPPEVVERRLAAARVEMAAESEFDVTLINDSVEETARQLVALLQIR